MPKKYELTNETITFDGHTLYLCYKEEYELAIKLAKLHIEKD